MSQSNPTVGQVIAGATVTTMVAVSLFWDLYGSDRAVVTRCIDVMLEAARGDSHYGEFLSLSREVEAADEIIITNREDNQIGSNTLTFLDFTIDGRPESAMCGT